MGKVTIFVNGASRGNPGPSAIGVLVVDNNGTVLGSVSESIGNATDEYASYAAVTRGLQLVADQFSQDTADLKVELKLDNQTVKEQINNEASIQNPGLVPYFIEVHNLKVIYFPTLSITLVSKKWNQDAIQLAGQALDAK